MNGALKYLSALSFSEALLQILSQGSKSSPRLKCSKLINECRKSLSLEKKDLSKKEIKKLFEKHKAFENHKAFEQNIININVILCFILALMDTILSNIKKDERYLSLEKFLNMIFHLCLNKRVDSNLDKFDDYAKAEELNKIWEKIQRRN